MRMSDTVEGTALRTSRVWCAATVEDGITLPRCAEVQRITSSAVPLLSQPMHWTMLPQQRRIAVMTLNTFVWMNQFMRCHHRHPSCLQRFLCLYLVILSWMLSFKWIQLLPATLCRIISSRKSARTQICNPPRPSWFRIQGKQSVHWVKSLWFTKTPSSSCSWTSMWWTYLASQPYLDCQTQVVCRCCTLTRRA